MLAARSAPLWALPLAALVVAGACTPESIFDQPADGAEAGDGDGDGGFEADRPRFLDPLGGKMTIAADHREQIVLRVQAFDPGSTNLLVDGKNLGTLAETNPDGRYESGRIYLHIAGALTEGVHSLSLYNPGEPSGEQGPPVGIEVTPAEERLLSFDLPASGLSGVRELGQSGRGATSQLLWVEDGASHPELVWRGADGTTWEDASKRAELEGYAVRDASFARVALQPDGEAWRASWKVGASGRSLAVATLSGEGETLQSQTQTWTEEDFSFLGAESLALGAPRLQGDILAIPVHAPRDTEVALPGDHALVYAPWPRGDAAPGQRLRLAPNPNANIGHLGPWFDLRAPDEDRWAATSSADGVWVRSIQEAGPLNALNFPEATPRNPDPLPAQLQYLATVAGALGSRTSLVLAGANSVLNLEAAFAERGESQELIGGPLPDLPASGPPAASCVAGRVIFWIPYGDQESWVVVSDGARGRAYPTGVVCDQVALARPDLSIGEEAPESLGAACLTQGELLIGQVSTDAP